MEYRILGKTGLRISRVGFGGIPIQRIEAAQAHGLLQAVADAGINFIDTAKAYTVSEAYIGESIEGMRDRFVLATKSGAKTRAAMAADISDSLRKLRTDYIDLYQIHNPNPAQFDAICAPGGALEALLDARDSGKIGHIGVTAHSAEVFERALTLDWVETIMFPYNIVETQGEALIARCAAQDIGFIAMKPISCAAQRAISASPCVSTMLYGNMIVSTQSSVSARSNTSAECAVTPMWPILPLSRASSSASSAPPGAQMASNWAGLGL